jgi:hypothetical protein
MQNTDHSLRRLLLSRRGTLASRVKRLAESTRLARPFDELPISCKLQWYFNYGLMVGQEETVVERLIRLSRNSNRRKRRAANR